METLASRPRLPQSQALLCAQRRTHAAEGGPTGLQGPPPTQREWGLEEKGHDLHPQRCGAQAHPRGISRECDTGTPRGWRRHWKPEPKTSTPGLGVGPQTQTRLVDPPPSRKRTRGGQVEHVRLTVFTLNLCC